MAYYDNSISDGADTVAQAIARHAYTLETDDPRPILVVLHQESSTPGRVGQVFDAHGVRMDIRRPVMGDALPETLDDHRGAVVFGGPPSANYTDAHLVREIEWMKVPLAEERPFSASVSARRCSPSISAPVSAAIATGWPRSASIR